MKIVLFADGYVGFEITKFLLKDYEEDMLSVVCTAENDIFHLVSSANISCKVYTNEVELTEHLNSIEFDLGVLAWWPKIISNRLLSLSKLGFINTHNSYLPNNRGKHPYFWAIVEERDYGVTLHWVDEGIDTGDIIVQRRIEYGWEDNSETIYSRSLDEMIKLFCESYPSLRSGDIKSYPQSNDGSFHYAKELDGFSEIDLEKSYKARDLFNIIRARTTSSDKLKSAFFKDGDDLFRVKISIKKE